MLLDDGYQLGVSVGAKGDRDIRWFRLADDALRAEVWQLMGRRIDIWSRAEVARRVEVA